VCRARALRMFSEDMIGDVRACLLSAELLRRVLTLSVRCRDGGG